jgi:transcriptional regulator of acetoin/glycerol metabolism
MGIVGAPTSGSALQHVLDRVEESGRPPGAVTDSIHLSWGRCADAGITPSHVAVPFEADVDGDSRLSWAAEPAMRDVGLALANQPVALLLTDQRGHIVQRFAGSTKTADLMDNLGAAPGFVCREELVGTNSIGMALLASSPNVVLGFEHYADNLTVVSCASAPVVHPATGQQLGVLNITSTADAFHPSLPALLDRVLAETRARLSEDHGIPSVALRAAFLSARRKAKGPLIAISGNTMFFNTAAGAALASHVDRAAVWAWAEQQSRSHPRGTDGVLSLSSGPRVATAVPVYDGASLAGALVSINSRPTSHSHAVPPDEKTASAWSSLTEAERTIAQHVARGLTNREAAVLLFLSPHTVDYHLRQIYRKLGVQSRVEMARAIKANT